MQGTPADTEKLLLSVAGMVARDRRQRGVRLNHPETVALLSTWVIERAREGAEVADLMQRGREVLGRAEVMDGVAQMLHDVQVEATFPDGRKLVTIHDPRADRVSGPEGPGAVRVRAGTVELNARPPGERISLVVTNTCDRPVQIGSHLHLPAANAALDRDREAAHGGSNREPPWLRSHAAGTPRSTAPPPATRCAWATPTCGSRSSRT